MTTPNKSEIIKKAFELHHERNHHISSINPTVAELKECGGYAEAQQALMRNDNSSRDYIEQEARALGYELKKSNPTELAKRVIASPFTVDIIEALKSGIYICGTTGSGKSDIGMYIASLLMKHDIIVIVFDSTQDWQSRSSVPYYHPVESAYIAEIPQESTIYDISRLSVRKRQRLVESFSNQLRRQQVDTPKPLRKKYFIFFEEAHTYFKEGCMRANRLENTVMVLSDGRNYDVRFGCIVQFSAMIDKNAMRYMKQRYFGWTNEKNDVEYLESFLGTKAHELCKLKAGEFMYSNPSENTLTKITIQPFTSETKPRKLEAQKPKPTLEVPKQNQDYSESLTSLIVACMWLAAIILALSQVW